MLWGFVLDPSGSECRPVVGYCEDGNESLGSVNGRECF
jgi:hypothetical protein